MWFAYPEVAATAVSDVETREEAGAEPRWVLRDVSFSIPAGGTLAIVGATGSGKSALLDLIPRVFDPQRGEILMDGVPVTALPLRALRQEIGYVPQESLLFSETIGANIAYGVSQSPLADVAAPELSTTLEQRAPGRASAPPTASASNHPAPPPPHEIVRATEVAQLAETIADLTDGFDTRLGERGINLSGGQKQRTALARALARRPHLVMLDDALSAVDTHTEAAILHGLRSELSGRTAIIASHRVSAVRNADWILVLHEGAIVEQGQHDDLMQREGRYAQLLRRQQLLEEVEAA